MAKFPSCEEKSGTNIRNAIFRELNQLGISAEQFSKIEWITDMIKAFEDHPSRRGDCAAHLINTVEQGHVLLSYSYVELRKKALEKSEGEKICKSVEVVVRAAKNALGLKLGFNLEKLQETLTCSTHAFPFLVRRNDAVFRLTPQQS
ncbi:Pyruvate kinase [Frankliniella fusca]|uniref:Pyruvate kinase n=1 Tax=Frankliniella fusca TaxID=407009 RepID=A0AAE1L8T7_9NEOP|nr:Pyruvate kinase [Frankliniella fusca]